MADVRVAETTTGEASRIFRGRVGICAFLVVCFLFIAGMKGLTYHEPVRGDQGIYGVIGHELLKGRSLYTDLWDHKPPAIHATYALAELVAGYGPQQLYLLLMTALTITLIGLYQAGTLLGGPRAGLCAAAMWAMGSIFPHWEGYQPNTEAFLDAFLVWGFYFVCRLNNTPSWSLACAFGVAIGIASLYKQVVIAPAVLIGLAYILGSGPDMRGRWMALRYMLAAGGVAVSFWVGCVAWFWSQGTFAEFYDCVFVYNRHYVGNVFHNLYEAYHTGHKSYLLAVTLPCLLVPFAAPRLDRAQRTGWLMLAAWAVGCYIANALPGRWQEYQLEIWMPMYALALGVMFAGLCWGEIERPRIWRWALLAMAVAPLVYRATHPHQYGTAPWSVYDTGNIEYVLRHSSRDASVALNKILLPGERMYALGVPGESCAVHFQTQQSPASGVFFDFPLRAGRPSAEKLEARVIRDLERDPPDLIVLSSVRFLALFEHKRTDWAQRLIPWVSEHYSRRGVDPTGHFLLFARRGSAIDQRLAEGEKPARNHDP
jgi:hypothetical protein